MLSPFNTRSPANASRLPHGKIRRHPSSRKFVLQILASTRAAMLWQRSCTAAIALSLSIVINLTEPTSLPHSFGHCGVWRVIALCLLVRVEAWHRLLSSMRSTALLLAGLFVAVVICEAFSGARLSRYLSRNFLNDLLYCFFYRGGIYTLFVYQPVFERLRPKLAILDLHLLGRMPAYCSFPIFLLCSDLFGYWIHRLQHTRYLWPFHCVHHSQQQLTFASFYRFHFVDQFLANTAAMLPLLLLGAPPKMWIPVSLLQWFLQAIQHSELNWRMGPLFRVISGPVFHSVHHSPEPRFRNKNFGMALSMWDFLFGTAVDAQERCRVYGVDGLAMPETIHGQFAMPFRMAYMQFRGGSQSQGAGSATAEQLNKVAYRPSSPDC